MNRRLLVVALLTALAAATLSIYVAGHPIIPEDVAVERDIQSVDWGPLAITFRFFSWIFANAIARVYTGAHWPTDVLGGILIAVAWLAFLASFRFGGNALSESRSQPVTRRVDDPVSSGGMREVS